MTRCLPTARDALAALIGAGIVCGAVVGWLGVRYRNEVTR